ncbi:MAG: hypothetical protein ACHQ03_10940 [Candidatus Bathyarchaeia archaeon]
MSNAPNAIEKEELWKALVDTAHALLMYKSHKRYVQEVMLKESPDISPDELAIRLNIPKGESLVLLAETRGEAGKTKSAPDVGSKSDDRSLLDFTR